MPRRGQLPLAQAEKIFHPKSMRCTIKYLFPMGFRKVYPYKFTRGNRNYNRLTVINTGKSNLKSPPVLVQNFQNRDQGAANAFWAKISLGPGFILSALLRLRELIAKTTLGEAVLRLLIICHEYLSAIQLIRQQVSFRENAMRSFNRCRFRIGRGTGGMSGYYGSA